MEITENELRDLIERLLKVGLRGDIEPAGFQYIWDWVGRFVVMEGRREKGEHYE